MSKKIDKHYVSGIDHFLQELWRTVPLSASQIQENEQYQRLGTLRDQVQPQDFSQEIWEEF